MVVTFGDPARIATVCPAVSSSHCKSKLLSGRLGIAPAGHDKLWMTPLVTHWQTNCGVWSGNLLRPVKPLLLKTASWETYGLRSTKPKQRTERVQRDTTERLRLLEQQLESERVQAELFHLRALEKLRAEHQSAIQREKDAVDEERKQMSAWIKDVKDGCNKEKKLLEERVLTLMADKEARVPSGGETAAATPHAPTERAEDTPTTPEREPTTRPEGGDGGGARTATH